MFVYRYCLNKLEGLLYMYPEHVEIPADISLASRNYHFTEGVEIHINTYNSQPIRGKVWKYTRIIE